MNTVFDFIAVFLQIYLLCIFAWALMSWFRIGWGHPLYPVQNFLNSIIDPYVKVFRQFIPPVQLGSGMMLDLSAMIGMFVIIFVLKFVLPAIAPA